MRQATDSEIYLLCLAVLCVISVAIAVLSLLNYILALQIWHARVTRPFLLLGMSGHTRLGALWF